MQSARTKQLLIIGNRRNRTNDLLRALSARRVVDPGLTGGASGRALGAHSFLRTAQMYKRLKSVEPKVDTGLRRRRRVPRDSSPRTVASVEDGHFISEPSIDDVSVVEASVDVPCTSDDNVDDDSMDDLDDDESAPTRSRIRTRCVRDAREALITLHERPLSPKSVAKFNKALDSIRAQRALVDLSMLREYRLLNKRKEERVEENGPEPEAEVDRIEDYDPSDQICGEFVSVWDAVAHESQDLLRREPMASMEDVEHHLLEHYPAIRNIFKYYSSLTKPFDENITAAELGSMSLGDWMQFVKDCKLIGSHPKRQLVKSSAELLFIRLNWVTDDRGRKVKNQDVSNSDRTLIMPEFMCGILRLAKQCGERMENLGLMASKFIEEVVCARAHSVDVEEFRTRMRFRSARAVLETYSTEISSVFARYAASQANDRVGAGLETLDFKEFMNLCRALNIVSTTDEQSLTPIAAQHAFALSQLQVVGEDAGEIDADEFIELISRAAESFFDCFFAVVYQNADRDAESFGASAFVHPRDVALAHKLAWFFPRLAAVA